MAELQVLQFFSGVVAVVFCLAVIVFMLILLGTVRRIRLEAIAINLRLRTLNTILREVHKDALPQKQCGQCGTLAPFGQNNCTKCKRELTW